jgi:hypothetical protein
MGTLEGKLMSNEHSVLMHLITIEKKDINLKFVFDHIRNYLICSTILASGLFVFKNGTMLIPFPWARWVEGGLLITIFIVLMALNLSQGAYAAKKLRVPKVIYFLTILILLSSAHELIWILIGQRS